MPRDRAAAVLSVGISLMVGGWLVFKLLPETRQNPVQADQPAQIATVEPSPEAPPPPAAAVVYLPLPPRPALSEKTAAPDPAKLVREAMRPRLEPPASPLPRDSIPLRPKVQEPKVREASPDISKVLPALGETVVKEGRVLLRILEQGSGPTIEIAWPDSSRERDRLFRQFQECYGMRIALMSPDGKLFEVTGGRGQAWKINLDRYSGFVRQSSGVISAEERRRARLIRDYHRIMFAAAPVRIFPRRVDAFLLGGLRRIIGAKYTNAKIIRATYRFPGNKVIVYGVRVDDRLMDGTIDLSEVAGKCSRG